jgi:hypothetical protein
MLKTILFGGTSISSNKPPVPKTQGRVWQVTAVTPGAIAFVAVLVCPITIYEMIASLSGG